jgi:hypothetical protein
MAPLDAQLLEREDDLREAAGLLAAAEHGIQSDPSHNGTTHDYPVFLQPLDTGPDPQPSPDGIHYEGNRSDSGGGITTQWSWVFSGSE